MIYSGHGLHDFSLRERPTNITDRIRLAIENEILSGVRPPGSAIDDKEVAKQFDASRTPVREALLMLSAQGLVDIAPRAGIYVHRPTAAELVATIEALTELEAVVAGLAARRATKELCDALSKAQAKACLCCEERPQGL